MLTICSVAYSSWGVLKLNWDLVSRLNRGDRHWTWVIVDNGPETDARNAFVRYAQCVVQNGRPADERVPISYRASLHHGVGLNQSLSLVSTRFALFLDPDFFIVWGVDWIHACIDYMLQKNVSFFGVPWHPKWYIKYRYFPCPHCLFIDLHNVPAHTLDFTPDYNAEHLSKGKKANRSSRKKEPWGDGNLSSAELNPRSLFPPKSFFRFLKRISISKRRRNIGCSRDTGYKIYKRYSEDSSVNFDGPIPVYKPNSDRSVEPFMISPVNRLIELFLPGHLRYLPKRQYGYSTKGFHEFGYPDLDSLGWEEFIWKGRPFGFHLRGQKSAKSSTPPNADFLRSVLERFAP